MSNPVIEFLQTRRSTPISAITAPAPSSDELKQMLEIAIRVPDHGRLAPWRFIVYQGDARVEAGKLLAELLEKRQGPLDEARREQELKRFARAPLVVGVVFKPIEHERIPEWEQFLSAGSAAMNLCHAANALGYASNWITNWYSDDADARSLLGLAEDERVAGFVHIGTCDKRPPERPRPEVEEVVAYYSGPYSAPVDQV